MCQNIYNDDGRQYLQMLQSIIERMAANSANCKTWMVSIVTAFLALVGTLSSLNGWILLGVLPVILFWFLDAYYLKIERGFRNREQEYINEVNNTSVDDRIIVPIYNFKVLYKNKDDEGQGYKSTKGVWRSNSVFWFYFIPLLVIIILSVFK